MQPKEGRIHGKRCRRGEFADRRLFAGQDQGVAVVALGDEALEYDFQTQPGQPREIGSLVGVMGVYGHEAIVRDLTCICTTRRVRAYL